MKSLIRNISGLMIIAILAGTILLFLGWSQIPDIVASKLTKKLQVPVEIGDIELSLKTVEVDKLEISNPTHCLLPRAFAADQIRVEAPLTRYLHTDIEIDEIEIDHVYLGLEFDSPTSLNNNWSALLNHAKTAQDDSKKGQPGKTVLIRRLVLRDIQTDLVYRNKGKKVNHLPRIKEIILKDISNSGGGAFTQILNSALGGMLKQVFVEQNMKDMLDTLFQQPSDNPLQETLDQFKNLFNALPPPKLEKEASQLARHS